MSQHFRTENSLKFPLSVVYIMAADGLWTAPARYSADKEKLSCNRRYSFTPVMYTIVQL